MADPLSNLGNVLMGAAQDYAQNKRQTDREALQREQRLADVADARQYEAGVRDEQRAFALAMQDKSIQDDIKRMLIHEGYDVSTPEKLLAASEDWKARGLDKRYNELMTTIGDDGKPLLERADLKDGAKIEAAKQKLNLIQGEQKKFLSDQLPAAEKEMGRLAGERQKIQSELSKLNQVLAEPERPPELNDVIKAAIQNLKSRNPNKKYQPSDVEIQAEVEVLMPKLIEAAAVRQFNKKQIAAVQANILSDQLKDIAADARSISARFPVVGRRPEDALVDSAAPVAAAPALTPEQMLKKFFDERASTRMNQAPEVARGSSIADRGGIFRVIGDKLEGAMDTFDNRLAKIAARAPTEADRARNRAALNGFFFGNPPITAAPAAPQWVDSPITAAPPPPVSPLNLLLTDIQAIDQQLSTNPDPATRDSLQRKKTAIQTEYEKRRNLLLGPQAPITPTMTNTSSFVQPFTPGAVLAPVN